MPRAKRALDRRQRSLIDLPEEILSVILLLLPPKSVLRCRAVCKAMRRLASDRAFLLAHHRRQPPQRLYSFIRDVGTYPEDLAIFDYCLEALDLRTYEFRSVARFTANDYDCSIGESPFAVLGSCDGLLLMSWSNLLYLCNPATRQWISISPLRLQHDTVMGLYCHGPSSDYRVLYCRRSDREPLFFINTVGSKKERCIQHGLSSVSMINWLHNRSEASHLSEPFLFNGSLHWMPFLGRQDVILVYDTLDEMFPWLNVSFKIYLVASLLEIEGTLAMSNSHIEASEVDLWFMDYNSSVWTHKYRIDLPVIDIRRFEVGTWLSQMVSQDRDVLVDGFNWQLYYDEKGNLLKKFKCNGRMLNFSTHILKESLVPHAFFQVRGNGSRREPPFFRGL